MVTGAIHGIKHVVVHDLEKDDHGFHIKERRAELNITPTVERVVEEIYGYYKKKPSKSYGEFDYDENNNSTKENMRRYLLDETGFLELTYQLMRTLKHYAERRGNVTRGHVFFADFEKDSNHFFLVAIVNQRLGAQLTENLDVKDVKHLDMEGFRFAGRINITAWEDDQTRYISFLKKTGEVSLYFQDFLGCKALVKAREDTNKLVRILKEFAKSNKLEGDEREIFFSDAMSFCQQAAKESRSVSLVELANRLRPQDPQNLLDTLVDPDSGLNDNFVPHSGALRELVKFKGHTSNWKFECDREALHDGDINYDAESNTITISNVPEDLAQKLKEEIKPDDE